MTITDYVIDILLIVVVALQLRTRELTPRSALRPLVLVVIAGVNYLRGFPVGGNDLLLIVAFALVGVALGTASGVATRVWRDDQGLVLVKAGLLAAALWVAGMGFRFAFAVYAHTDGGLAVVTRLARQLEITSAQAWTTALVLMAFGEVLSRITFLEIRRHRLLRTTAEAPEYRKAGAR
jgi:hypothetical protein